MTAEVKAARVLLVDDDELVLRMLARVLHDHAPLVARDGIAARELLRTRDLDVVVCDLGLPGLGGLDLIRWAKEHCTGPLWIVVSGENTFDAATQALKLGVFDFLCKPFVSPIQLQSAVTNALRQQDLLRERARLVRGLEENNIRLEDNLRKLEASHLVLRDQRSMLEQDLQRAERILMALLPRALPRVNGMQLNVAYRPADVIGGDLYGAKTIGDDKLALYVADAAGHGVSAALLAVLFKQRLRLVEADQSPRHPADVLADLNGELLDECHASGLFVSVIYALVDTRTRTATIASAGHPPALLVRRSGAIEHLEKTGPALGLEPKATFAEHRVELASGDRLFLYTDGLTDSLPAGATGLDAAVADASARERDGAKAIERLVHTSAEAGQRADDVTLLLLSAGPGRSTIDAARDAEAAPPSKDCPLWFGAAEGTTWIALRGRATWKDAPAVRDACLEALAAGKRAVIDLGGCTTLDSTVLGTLHELSDRAGSPAALRIQNVGDDARRLFAELAMTRVQSFVSDAPLPMPTDMAAAPSRADLGARGLVLHAHELLAQLSPENAAQFTPVIEALRRDAH